jgi:hypothetical protein
MPTIKREDAELVEKNATGSQGPKRPASAMPKTSQENP